MKTVLIVEDEKLIRQGLRKMIQRSGVPVEVIMECNNGETALEILKEQSIDVMFTDIRMPKMDGIELVERMQECEHIPLTVAISGYDDFNYAVAMMHNGVREYLLKPISNVDLETALRRVVGIVQEKHQKQKKQEKKGENEKQFWEDLLVQCLQEEYWIERAKKSGYCTPDETFRLILLRCLQTKEYCY